MMANKKSELNQSSYKRDRLDDSHSSFKNKTEPTTHQSLKRVTAAQDEKCRMEDLINNLDISAVIIDAEYHISYVTPMGFKNFNLTERIIGCSIATLAREMNCVDLTRDIEAAIRNKNIRERKIKTIHGDWMVLKIVPLVKKDYLVEGAIMMLMSFVDTQSLKYDYHQSEHLKNAEELLYNMAHYDELTQLPNRASFIHLMMDIIDESVTNNTQFVLMCMDLDNFKRVNDNLGHALGDALLRVVANILKKITRRHDVIARLGGDEFGMIIKNVHTPMEVEKISQRYIQAFSKCIMVDGHEIKTSPSIGLAFFPQFGRTPYELLQNADAAMYYAKQRGKNSYYLFDNKVKNMLMRRHAIDTQLQHALEKKEFSLVYQLKFNLKDNRPMGVEVLLRWSNEVLGTVDPDEFIPVAEENRLVVPIGYWIIGQVLKDYKKIASVLNKRPFSVAINMSMTHLSEPDFEVQIKQLLLQSKELLLENVIFELTETALMQFPDVTSELLHNISKLGIQFALDDFGTGYSSLQHIKNLPITSIKIDKSFIADLSADKADVTIVRAMIAFAKILGMVVTAEGIENSEQMKFLQEEGCDEGQGFILSKPLPLKELIEYLKNS